MSGRVVSDIQTRAEGCISDTTQTLMLYIAYDTPTSKCSCLSTILKIKAILAEFCIRYTTTVMPLISFVFSS